MKVARNLFAFGWTSVFLFCSSPVTHLASSTNCNGFQLRKPQGSIFRWCRCAASGKNMRLVRALSTALCVILASTWSYSQEHASPGMGLSKAVENNDVSAVRPDNVSSGLQLPSSFSFDGIDKQASGPILAVYPSEASQPPSPAQVTELGGASSRILTTINEGRFEGQFSSNSRRYSIGTDLYSPPEFKGGLIVYLP
jgi:hypothetical protein